MMMFFSALKTIVVAGGLGHLAICGYLYLNQARFIFPGAFSPFPPEITDLAPNCESAQIHVSDGERIFALVNKPRPGKPVILVFHGNGSYPEVYGFLYERWITAGYGFVAPVARGYPRSSGTPEGNRMLSDAVDIFDWTSRTYPGHPIHVFGQSLGTAPAVHLAAERPVAKVVLVSPFASMLGLVSSKMPWFPISLLLDSPFRSDLDIPRVKAPILVFHGDMDDLVPLQSGRDLVALATAPVRFEIVTGAGHGRGLFTPDMIAKIDDYIGR